MKENNTSENPAPERDIYSDPTITPETYDPVAEFIKRQWKPLLVTVLLAFSLVYIRDAFRESRQRSLEAGANAFFETQEAFARYREARKKSFELEAQKLPDEAAAKETELKNRETARTDLTAREERVKQTLTILAESAEPYNSFAPIVTALMAHEKGDAQAVRTALKDYSTEMLIKTKGPEKLRVELALMAMARSLLDSPESETEARRILTELARNGDTVAVSAALTLSRIAATPEEKKQAQELKTDLLVRFPEQATVLKE